jgi:ubiquinone/menaquinone biosynthesis C-methylase UbiE
VLRRNLMRGVDKEELKKKVHDYWNQHACGTETSSSEKFTRDYFDDIEAHRYSVEPEIFAFAQFTRFHGQRILEVGIGAGTDFLQWVRAGTVAYGVDLTPEGIEHVDHRLRVYGLKAEDIRVADCEALPYQDNTFDLVYSWGVIHHTPDTRKALREIVRVCRPGGICKIMVYNRHSVVTFCLWAKQALLKFRPWKTLSWCLYHHMESLGTKAFTPREMKCMLRDLPVDSVQINPILTWYDRFQNRSRPLRMAASMLANVLGGNRRGWFMLIQFTKKLTT